MLSASYRQAGDEGFYLVALVQDLTPEGASLILSRPMDAGTRLQLKVQRPDSAVPVRRDLEIRHISPYGDAAWIAGCLFDQPLEAEEFEALK
jgi:hypothetical protein